MINRRTSTRINVNLRALLHNGDEVSKARIVNLSTGGVFLWTEYPDLRPGTDVGIDIDGENVGHILGVSGHVIHKNKLGLAIEITQADKNLGLLIEREGRQQ